MFSLSQVPLANTAHHLLELVQMPYSDAFPGPESPQGLVNNIHFYQGERFDTEAEEKQTWAVWKRLPSGQ
ncbi:hypothetical protein DPX16_7276 [Anabarilius grahami]|uniref:Uncharacterized protein n=1 Tax=Anabarilius grahami TaxID=495550 RepID=A0A3N0XMW9_ANAGA|nr:hypothetical protein DPX16_7276 [Anabarilius grahami]